MWNMHAKPLPAFAHQKAHGACQAARLEFAFAKIEQRIHRAAITHLVVQTREDDIVAFAASTLGVHQKFRHDKERNAFGARRQRAIGIRNLGQHQMHNVLGQRVIAAGDPHLVAGQPIGAVGHRDRARLDVGERRSGLRLG